MERSRWAREGAREEGRGRLSRTWELQRDGNNRTGTRDASEVALIKW